MKRRDKAEKAAAKMGPFGFGVLQSPLCLFYGDFVEASQV